MIHATNLNLNFTQLTNSLIEDILSITPIQNHNQTNCHFSTPVNRFLVILLQILNSHLVPYNFRVIVMKLDFTFKVSCWIR